MAAGGLAVLQAGLWALAPFGESASRPPLSFAGGWRVWINDFGSDVWFALPLLILGHAALLLPVVLGTAYALQGRLWPMPRWAWISLGLASLPLIAWAALVAAFTVVLIAWGAQAETYHPALWLVPGLAVAAALWAVAHGLFSRPR